jgi:hypothetical protein
VHSLASVVLLERLGANAPVGLHDALDDARNVKRSNTAQVNDLRLDAVLLLQDLSGFQAQLHHARVPDQRDVLALALDLGFTDGQDKVVFLRGFAEGEGLAVEDLVFEENDGVGVSDGGFEQAFAVFCGVGRDDFQAWDLAVPEACVNGVVCGEGESLPRGVVLGMLSSNACCCAIGTAEDDCTEFRD